MIFWNIYCKQSTSIASDSENETGGGSGSTQRDNGGGRGRAERGFSPSSISQIQEAMRSQRSCRGRGKDDWGEEEREERGGGGERGLGRREGKGDWVRGLEERGEKGLEGGKGWLRSILLSFLFYFNNFTTPHSW